MPSAHHPSRRGRRTGSEASSSHLKVLGSPAHDESKQTRPKIALRSAALRRAQRNLPRKPGAARANRPGHRGQPRRGGHLVLGAQPTARCPLWMTVRSRLRAQHRVSGTVAPLHEAAGIGRRGARPGAPPTCGNRSAAERYGAINPVITSNLSRWRYAAPAEPRRVAAPPPGAPSAAALLGAPPPDADPPYMLPACFAGVVLLCSAPLAALLHCANGYR